MMKQLPQPNPMMKVRANVRTKVDTEDTNANTIASLFCLAGHPVSVNNT